MRTTSEQLIFEFATVCHMTLLCLFCFSRCRDCCYNEHVQYKDILDVIMFWKPG